MVYRMQNRQSEAEAAHLRAISEVRPIADEYSDRSDFIALQVNRRGGS